MRATDFLLIIININLSKSRSLTCETKSVWISYDLFTTTKLFEFLPFLLLLFACISWVTIHFCCSVKAFSESWSKCELCLLEFPLVSVCVCVCVCCMEGKRDKRRTERQKEILLRERERERESRKGGKGCHPKSILILDANNKVRIQGWTFYFLAFTRLTHFFFFNESRSFSEKFSLSLSLSFFLSLFPAFCKSGVFSFHDTFECQQTSILCWSNFHHSYLGDSLWVCEGQREREEQKWRRQMSLL